MNEFKLMQHKHKPEVKYWIRKYAEGMFDGSARHEIRTPRNPHFGSQEIVSPEMSARSGYFPANAVKELYREAKNV